jgi:hypothetical protein
MTPAAIIDALEAGETGTEIDCRAHHHCGAVSGPERSFWIEDYEEAQRTNDWSGLGRSWSVPFYTTSIDAAMSLPLGPGWRWQSITRLADDTHVVRLVGDDATLSAVAPTPAGAYCAAAVRSWGYD